MARAQSTGVGRGRAGAAHDTIVVARDFFLTREGLASLLAGVPGIVESHVTSIFRKLGVTDHRRVDRRVAAVIAYLNTFGP